MSDTFSAEVAVIGGGPAGLVAAIALATAGVDTLLIAPPAEPDHRTTALLAGSVTALEKARGGAGLRAERRTTAQNPPHRRDPAARSRAGSFVCLSRNRSRRVRLQHRKPAPSRRARGARGGIKACSYCWCGALDCERCCRRDHQARQWRSTSEASHWCRRPTLAVPGRRRHRNHATRLSANGTDAQSGPRAAA